MKDREPVRMETIAEHEITEILPVDVGRLPSSEATPILNRAASRIDIVRPKNEFWNGMKENLRGAGGWIEAQGAKFKGRTLNIIAGLSFATTVAAACSKPPETPYLPTEVPRVTETIPTEMPLPTETPTLEPTSTIEVTPTPTEIPIYTGPLTDVTEWIYVHGQEPVLYDEESHGGVREDWGIDTYRMRLPYPVTLISTSKTPENEIVEMIWGFRLRGEDYRFRVLTAPFYTDLGLMNEINMDKLFLGDRDYRPTFQGIETPIEGTVYERLILSLPENESFRIIAENLRNEPRDKKRLMDFLRNGITDGFEIDEDGIVDLTRVIWGEGTGRFW